MNKIIAHTQHSLLWYATTYNIGLAVEMVVEYKFYNSKQSLTQLDDCHAV